jgi:hypothetical protein
VRVLLAESWTDADHDAAVERAREVVRAIRRGELFDVGGAKPFEDDHVFRALVGSDLLHAVDAQEDEA